MVLVDMTPERVEIPHAPGSFVLLKRLTGRDAFALQALAQRTHQAGESALIEYADGLISRALVGWGGPAFGGTEFSRDAAAAIDEQTYAWLLDAIRERMARPLSGASGGG